VTSESDDALNCNVEEMIILFHTFQCYRDISVLAPSDFMMDALQVTSESGELGAPFSTIHVLDLRNRMAAASITLQHVLAVVPAWGALMVVTGSGKIYLLKEVELASQVGSHVYHDGGLAENIVMSIGSDW
jgi:hypothetical protein